MSEKRSIISVYLGYIPVRFNLVQPAIVELSVQFS